MKKKARIGAIFLSLVFLSSLHAELVDRIVAVVGNQVITQSELEKAYRNDELGLRREASAPEQVSKRQYLEQMIEKMLIEQEVKRQGISVTVLEVEQAIERKRQELGMSQADFLQALRSQGLTLDQYREQVQENLVRAKLVSREVRSEIEVTDQEIELFYHQHQAEFRTPDKIHLYHLVLRPGKSVSEKIELIRKEFSKGVPFPELAKKYSEGEEAQRGGDLGWIEITALKPELARILEKLEINQLSPVYQDQVGFHLFWIQGKEQGIPQTLDQVREQIRQILERKQFNERYQLWLERLKAKAYIEIRL